MFRSIDRVLLPVLPLLAAVLLIASAALADFDPDLAISTFQGTTGVYCAGDDKGGFDCAPVTGESPNSFRMAADDIDGNHRTDLVFANDGAKNVICYGQSAPDTYSCNTVGVDENQTSSVALGRVDGDEFVDIVFANNALERDRLCTWAFMGLFDCSDISADQRASAHVALGDFDGDGNLDAVFADVSSNQESRICLGDGSGGFSCSEIAGTQHTSIAVDVGDFDQDGNLDAVFANSNFSDLVCAGNGDGTFVCAEIDLLVYPTFDVGVGEFNGDDEPDLVFATKNEASDDPKLSSRVCFGGSGVSFSCEHLPIAGTQSFGVAVADWNRDGADDIAVVQRDGPAEICLGANDGTFSCSNISDDAFKARDVVPVIAEPIKPLEKDFEVEDNLDETGFENFEPEVDVLGNQGFVIVWRTVDGADDKVLRANITAPGGTLYEDTIEIESITAGEQYLPDVSIAQTGNFVVVWTYTDTGGQHPDSSGSGVAGRLFNGSGTPMAGQFDIPTFKTGNQSNARVAMSPDGSFLVVWDSIEQANGMGITAGRRDFSVKRTPDGSGFTVMGRLFDENGNAKTDEFIINETTELSQFRPHVAARRDGSFVVVWESLSPTFAADVFARIVEADGSMPAGEIPVHPPTLGEQQLPDVAAGSDGRFVVTWQTPQDLDESFGVRARVFDADGTPLTDEFEVNEPDGHDQQFPRAAFGAGRRFVIVWRHFDVPRQRAEEIRAREFEPTGRKVGEEFQVNTAIDELGLIGVPSVAGAPNGRVVFVWPEARRDDPSESDIYRRRFENTSAPQSGTTTSTSSTSSTTVPTTSTTSTTTTTLPPTTTSTLTTSTNSTPTSSVTTTTVIPALECGDPVVDGAVTASDALFVLGASIGLENCETCVCDVNDSGAVTAADALAVLSAAVGLDVELVCQPCI
jgi:hypothetical protein